MKIACKGVCVAMMLCCSTGVRAQDQEAWTFGGNGGVSWSDWMDLNVMVDDFSTPSAIQPRELRPGVNLLPQLTALGDAVSLSSPEGSFWSRWQKPLDPFWEDGLPRMWRGYQNLSWATVFMPIEKYVDGDPTTFNWFLNFGPGCNKTASEFYTIDVGAPVPVTGFRLVEPPETETDPFGNPWAEGYSPTDRFGEPWANYIPKHGEFSGAVDPAPIATEGEDEHICSLVYKPLEFVLGGVEQNLVAPIEFTFPRQYLRFFRWRTYPENTRTVGGQTASSVLSIAKIAYAEFELYGDGFTAESRYRSHVVDLGRTATLGAVTMGVSKWRREGDALVEAPDADASLAVRIKTGTTPDPRQYHTYNDQSEYVEISGEEFSQLKVRANPQDPQWVGWQGPVTEDRTNWTPWSGLIKNSGTQVGLRSGQYFTVEVELESGTPTEMVRLDSLAIEISPLLASRLVGELALAADALFPAMPEIPVGEEVVISYAISAGVEPGSDGFDALHIATPSQPRFLSLMAGTPLAALDPEEVLEEEDGLTLFLPERVESDQDLRIDFGVTLFTVSAQLNGAVFNRDKSDRRQFIEAGDASREIGSDLLQLVADDNSVRRTLGDVAIRPRVITPNQDGRNDLLQIDYTLYGVLGTEVEILFYDLAGRVVSRFSASGGTAGTHTVQWNGMDESGQVLPPGVYLCEIAAETGAGRFESISPVAVAY